jgi:hypothetical protein
MLSGVYGSKLVTECATHIAAREASALAFAAEQAKEAGKLQSRYLWENYYVEQCRAMGLPDVATTEQIQAKLEQMEAEAMATGNIVGAMQALKKGVELLAVINAITQNGGRWEEIAYHPELAGG